MASHHEFSISLPTGPLGLGIQKHETTGLCFVASADNVESPLRPKDILLSLNGIQLADVHGGVDPLVKLFVEFASGPRNVVVRRAFSVGEQPPANPRPVDGTTANANANADGMASAINVSRPPSSLTAETIARMDKDLAKRSWVDVPSYSGGAYVAGIISAITKLKDRTGSSIHAIRGHMQANLPANRKWVNHLYLSTLKKMLATGDLVQVPNKQRYKLSVEYQARAMESKQIDRAKKTKHALTKQPAPVARASLSPVPFAAPVATAGTFASYPAAKATLPAPTQTARAARVSLSPPPSGVGAPKAIAASKPQPGASKTNFIGGVGDIARKALEIAASSNSAIAPANAALAKLRQQEQLYRSGIIAAIKKRKKRSGSAPTLKHIFKMALEKTGEHLDDSAFNATLRKMVRDGELVQDKSTYRLSNDKQWMEQQAAIRAMQQTTTQPGERNGVSSNNFLAVNAATAANTKSAVASAAIQPEKCVVDVTKPSKETSLGLGIQQKNGGAVQVSKIAPNSLLVGTMLKVGMELESINGNACTTVAEAVTLLRAAEGRVTIVAMIPKPMAQVTSKWQCDFCPIRFDTFDEAAEHERSFGAAISSSAEAEPAVADADMKRRIEAARVAAGYTLPAAPQPW